MFLKYKQILAFLLVFSCFLFTALIPNITLAYKSGLDETVQSLGDDEKALTKDSPDKIVGKIVGSLLSFVGVGFFVLVFIGGITWMTAAGNEQQIDKAKQMIIAAVFGLIIVLSAYGITAFIGKTLITSAP